MAKKNKTGNKKKNKKADVKVEVPALPDPDMLVVPCLFIPKEDITTYELATLIHYLLKGNVTFGDWKTLEKSVIGITRHLQPMQTAPEQPVATPDEPVAAASE